MVVPVVYWKKSDAVTTEAAQIKGTPAKKVAILQTCLGMPSIAPRTKKPVSDDEHLFFGTHGKD